MSAEVTIDHNPACGTSHQVLMMIRNAGIEPRIIEDLKTSPSRDASVALLARMGLSARQSLPANGRPSVALLARMGLSARQSLPANGRPHAGLGPDDAALCGDALIDALLAQPIRINRPIVSLLGAARRRRSDRVLELPPRPQLGAFAKEDSGRVVDERGARIEAGPGA